MLKAMRFGLLSVCTGIALAVAACGSDNDSSSSTSSSAASSKEPIVIGQAKGFTGFMQSFDVPPANAAALAVADINAKGGIDGRKVKIVKADTQTKVQEGRRAALDVKQKGANFIQATGDFDLGAPVATQAQKDNIVAMSDIAGSVQFGPQGIGPLAFTMGTPGITEGYGIWDWAAKKKNLSHPFILEDPSLEYYKQAVAGFKQAVQNSGAKLAGFDTYSSNDPSIAPTVEAIKKSGADSMLLTGLPSAGAAAIKQIRSAGIDIPILTINTYDGDTWKKSVPNVSNVYFTTYGSLYGDDPRPFVNQLVARYTKKFGKPDNSNLLTGYAVVEALQKAVDDCDCVDGQGLAKSFEKFNNTPLVGGALVATFTPELHATIDRPLTIMQIDNGKSSYLTTWKLSQPPKLQF